MKASIVGKNVLVAYQEQGKMKLSKNESGLVYILTNLLNDENSVTFWHRRDL